MQLLYVLCQLAAADVCEEHRSAYVGEGPMACVLLAQADLARMIRPGWRVASWRCEHPDLTASAAPAGL